MPKNILVIKTGSTSTKLAVYQDKELVVQREYKHGKEELDQFPFMADQVPMRLDVLHQFIAEETVDLQPFDAIVARGGILPPVQSGGYIINDDMCDYLENICTQEHASNLAAFIALPLSKELGIENAFIYDAVSTDELEPIARVTGLAEVPRVSMGHALNQRAVAHKLAEQLGKPYNKLNLIVAHLGGGISLSAHRQGRMVDNVRDDEGPFSPERSGRIQLIELLKYLDDKDLTLREQIKLIRGGSGLKSLLGTNDALDVENRAVAGEPEALLAYQAMAYQISKGIGELATVLCGKVDAILLTGSIARSQPLVEWIRERVEFIAPLHIIPGENEMEALAAGALRILKEEEEAHVFDYHTLFCAHGQAIDILTHKNPIL